jgi:hypothetical protein
MQLDPTGSCCLRSAAPPPRPLGLPLWAPPPPWRDQMVPLPFVHQARWREREIGFPSPPTNTQVPRDSAVGEVEVSGTRLSGLQ